MTKILAILFILLLSDPAFGQTIKISEMTADSSPTSDDLMVTVDDPAGTPTNKKVNLGDAITQAHGLSDGAAVVSGGVLTNVSPGSAGNVFKSNGTSWTSSNTLDIAVLDLTSATSSIPFPVGTAAAPTTEGHAYWNSTTDTLTIGTGAAALSLCTDGLCKIPSGTAPTVDAAGKIAVDTTSDMLTYYGSAARSIPYKQFFSIVVPSVADTDDMLLLKLPYGVTILALDCIVSAATSATINIQECSSTGTDCADMATDDLACDTDGANTTTFGGAAGSTADAGDWLKLDVASISGTPGTLTVTVTYSVVGD